MSELKDFFYKSIALRERLIQNGKSKRGAAVRFIVLRFKQHLKNYPNIKDYQLARYISKYYNEMLQVLPGKGSPSHQAQRARLEQLLSNHL